MRKLLVITTLVLSLPVMAETGLFLEGGLEVHSKDRDCPEYCGSNPLGNIGAGYTFKPADKVYVDAYVNHKSSIKDTEIGLGENVLGVRGRWYLK